MFRSLIGNSSEDLKEKDVSIQVFLLLAMIHFDFCLVVLFLGHFDFPNQADSDKETIKVVEARLVTLSSS